MPRLDFLLALTLVSLALTPSSASQGVPGPAVPADLVRMARLEVRVTIQDGVASTALTQVWRNDGASPAEATWVLPLAPGEVADGFRLTVDGVPLSGEVLSAESARGVYEGIVRSRRDPGLLEYLGRGCLRARIFPIPPHGEARAEVGFRALLPERLGVRAWSFALRAAGGLGLRPDTLLVDLRLSSKRPIGNAFSPLAALQVLQKNEHEVHASYEGSAAALGSQELALYYGLSEAEFGLDLLAHRAPGDPEGTFLMLISPRREWQAQDVAAKSIAFVLDTSGSMQGPKMEQARKALLIFLRSLGPADRFDVVPFATEPQPFFGRRVPASESNLAEAIARVERLTAAGGTAISGALEQALSVEPDPEHVSLVVFLTDGQPTIGPTDPEAVLAAARAANRAAARVFVLGVGDDLDTHLLDRLAEQSGGARDYVRAEERIDDKARALFVRLSRPVMTDLSLTVDGLTPTQLAPGKLPDLFAGDRLELFGRYSGEGAHAIHLAGTVGGVRREYVYEGTFPRESSGELGFIAPLWAERRVGILLDAIRLNGAKPELVAEVQRLGRTYRIVTPYTSHLVVEPGLRPLAGGDGLGLESLGYGGSGDYRGPSDTVSPSSVRGKAGVRATVLDELVRDGILPANAAPEELEALARSVVEELGASARRWDELGSATSGAAAVEESQVLAGLMQGRSGAESVLERFTRRVQDKVFALRGGIWIDQACGKPLDPARRRVEAFSSAYFELLASRPALAPYLALSTRLVVRLGDEVLEIYEPATAAGSR